MATSDGVSSGPRTVDGVAVHAAHKAWAMGELGPFLMVIWRGLATQEAVLQINERIGDLTQRLPGKCVYINVIEPRSPTPPAPVRKLAMEGLSRPGLGCKVAVIEGHELRAALVRAILTGMALLRREEQPTKWFKNTREMSLWVKNQLHDAGDLDQQIVRAAEVIRNQMPTS
jgi:hypothetical protein